MDYPAVLDSVARGVERVGIPAGLIFAGLFLISRLAKEVGPAIAKFLDKLSDKLESHTVDHVKLEGKIEANGEKIESKLDVHHEKTTAEIRRAAAVARSSADSVRSDVLAKLDDVAGKIIDRFSSAPSRDATSAPSRDATPTPVSGVPRTPVRSRCQDEDTQESEK